MLYFAYGSNLNHHQMNNRCDGAKYIKKHIGELVKDTDLSKFIL